MSLINLIESYIPYNEQEAKDKELILKALSDYDNLLTRENPVMHITSSGYVVNKSRDKVLMIYHKIYNSWAWTGGHADGDADLLYVAIKEAKEETGIKNVIPIVNDIFSLDVITVNGHIKRGSYVSSHLHLNITYLLEADENEELIVNEEETEGVKWLPIDKLSDFCTEEHIIKNIYDKLNKKIKSLK
ncbi:NUDIX domain [uncultured Clostridium sp.]|uniref:NUDIX hydrolase n=1 Tax=uncultured Clostridium sp. TaxID=59620 RepID=UPI0008213794|nr:NUDIX hydrolase [uncultured Clostridium sp.]SCJ93383.1 NUDIX domain [uncultured Clostridium sp.]